MTARLPIILDANRRTISPQPPDTVAAPIVAGERTSLRFLECFAANMARTHETPGFQLWNRLKPLGGCRPLVGATDRVDYRESGMIRVEMAYRPCSPPQV
jgi:hypothetical protein